MKRLILALLLASTSAFGANILSNPGFETGVLSPWTNGSDFCGGCVWGVDGADAHSGTQSAFVDGNRLMLQTFTAIAVSDILEASFWAKHPASVSGAAMYVSFDYSDATSNGFIISTTSSDWEFFNVTSNLAAGKSLVSFGVYGNSGTLARFDDALIDVGVPAVPEPTTWTLLAAGLVLAGWRKRRDATR